MPFPQPISTSKGFPFRNTSSAQPPMKASGVWTTEALASIFSSAPGIFLSLMKNSFFSLLKMNAPGS